MVSLDSLEFQARVFAPKAIGPNGFFVECSVAGEGLGSGRGWLIHRLMNPHSLYGSTVGLRNTHFPMDSTFTEPLVYFGIVGPHGKLPPIAETILPAIVLDHLDALREGLDLAGAEGNLGSLEAAEAVCSRYRGALLGMP